MIHYKKLKQNLKFAKKLDRLLDQVNSKTVLVACSGGIDSCVLLHMILRYVERRQNLSIYVVHIDHNQRSTSKKDALFVKDLCKKYKVSLKEYKLKVGKGLSEDVLRKLRYQKIFESAKKLDAFVVTGHHAKDQLETYLFRVIRGAHPSTIKAIPEVSTRDGVEIIRPLLTFWKDEIVDYAKQNSIGYCSDESNESFKYTRNVIRLKLLPLLEKIRPKSQKHFLRFFEDIHKITKPVVHSDISPELYRSLTQGELISITEVEFDVVKKIIDHILGEENSQSTNRVHWHMLEKELKERKSRKSRGGPQKVLQFPGGYAVEFIRDQLRFKKVF